MTSLTKFATSGYHVFGSHESLLTMLPDTLHVKGRIATNTVWAYVDRLRGSNLKVGVVYNCKYRECLYIRGQGWVTWV